MKYKYHQDFCLSYVLDQADLIADCFVLSGEWGINSTVFAEKMMLSNHGILIMTDVTMIEYSDYHYMLEGFVREFNLKTKETEGIYKEDILWMAGYLYKYWVSTKDMNPVEVYKLAPIDLLAKRYGFYHTQGWDYNIQDLMER